MGLSADRPPAIAKGLRRCLPRAASLWGAAVPVRTPRTGHGTCHNACPATACTVQSRKMLVQLRNSSACANDCCAINVIARALRMPCTCPWHRPAVRQSGPGRLVPEVTPPLPPTPPTHPHRGGGATPRVLGRQLPLPPPPPRGLRPTVSCQRCRPQSSMGAKGARCYMNTKGAPPIPPPIRPP